MKGRCTPMSWCEHCEKEFAGTVCPVCGGELLQEIIPEEMEPAQPNWGGVPGFDSLKEWPVGPDGRPEKEVLLETAPDYQSYAGLTVARLEAYRIPVLSRYSAKGELGKIIGGFSSCGVKLYVPASRLEEAKALLLPEEEEDTQP